MTQSIAPDDVVQVDIVIDIEVDAHDQSTQRSEPMSNGQRPEHLQPAQDAPWKEEPASVGTIVCLDPAQIQCSTAPNRLESAYSGPAFDVLKSGIQNLGRNVETIKVRRIPQSNGDSQAPQLYEIVYGHRRVRACAELGLMVEAVVAESMDERRVVLERLSENSGRKDFSALELGRICVDALKRGLFKNQSELALALGRDAGDLSKAIHIAQLPAEVLAAFDSPDEIQFRHAKPLTDAVKRNSIAVIETALALSEEPKPKTPSQVLARLTGASGTKNIGPSNISIDFELVWNGTQFGQLRIATNGNAVVTITDVLDQTATEMLRLVLQDFYGQCIAQRVGSRHLKRLEAGR